MVVRMRHFSGWAGAMALAIIVVPVVVRTTENMLLLVPTRLREAAAALGAPRWKVALQITYRAAGAGILTGVLLAVARISGETAPLLFTALNNQFWSLDMNAPMANLPVVIFQFAMSPYEDWQRLAWAGSLLITLSVLALNIAARLLFRKRRGAEMDMPPEVDLTKSSPHREPAAAEASPAPARPPLTAPPAVTAATRDRCPRRPTPRSSPTTWTSTTAATRP